ncbi:MULTISPECIES: TraR/DksA C4-type zinc finger protein [Tissierellales]|jgi:YteA family regulatory protein|uniref:Molecular chaperone DnaK n=1 Tax=Acidilutibacter cellobiosedens TaxID=2507161 RepID=A0A410QC43_9FIRM|nr:MULTISPECIES: TraR/DksA C4-type zinc finger protein [Tissierellales]QAT61540.1 molecular chaperone DnaK [Acidilutibacter cellobiosedens]SCL83492.1 General stress protein 16O [Sporanaerobacter sp. PP17-6a]
MNKEKIEHYKKLLGSEKKKVEKIIERMEYSDDSSSMERYYSELSFYDNHPGDLGTEMFMMEQDKGMKDKLNDTLKEIEVSESKLYNDKFGLCDNCGRKIEDERLEIIPYANLCAECSKKKALSDEEKIFETKPESMKSFFPANGDKVEFDSEDSYQAVDRYNRVKNDPSFSTGDYRGMLDEDDTGTVEEVEKISEEYYKKGLD